PAHRLHDAALDLVANAIGIDRLSAVNRAHGADDAHAARLALDFGFYRDCAIGREILVAREGEAASTPARLPVARPPEPGSGPADRFASARVFEVAQAKFDGIDARGYRKLVDEALDRENVHVRAESPQRRHPDGHRRNEVMHDARIGEV